jgi:hypothetical protein
MDGIFQWATFAASTRLCICIGTTRFGEAEWRLTIMHRLQGKSNNDQTIPALEACNGMVSSADRQSR